MSNRRWYFTRQEIVSHSPSRRHGITFANESSLRSEYCSHIGHTGRSLRVPQSTIAAATMLCHRFYARQSHAKNDWRAVSTACLLLACKSQNTPRPISDIVSYAYHDKFKDHLAARLKNPRQVGKADAFLRVTKLIIVAERLVLKTIGFDLHIELPYKPLALAVKRLSGGDIITGDAVSNLGNVTSLALNLVDEWLKSSLCLEYRPHYIAAGSVLVAAGIENVKLPAGDKWLREIGVSAEKLDELVRRMESKVCKSKTNEVVRSVCDRVSLNINSRTYH